MNQLQRALVQSQQNVAKTSSVLLWLNNTGAMLPPHVRDMQRQSEQAKIDATIGALAVVALFAAFDIGFEQEFNGKNLFKSELASVRNRLASSTMTTLAAYRHVRNVAAHGFDGQRAGIKSFAKEFEHAKKAKLLPMVDWDPAIDVIRVGRAAAVNLKAVFDSSVEELMNT